MNCRVFCTLEFEAYHWWADAPDQVAFLRNKHRHVFHVRAEKGVQHYNRDVEFIGLKRKLQQALDAKSENWSCEQWAAWLMKEFTLDRVEVSEDGENGAVITA